MDDKFTTHARADYMRCATVNDAVPSCLPKTIKQEIEALQKLAASKGMEYLFEKEDGSPLTRDEMLARERKGLVDIGAFPAEALNLKINIGACSNRGGCDKVGKMALCGGCENAFYCGKKCQIQDRNEHRNHCIKLRESIWEKDLGGVFPDLYKRK